MDFLKDAALPQSTEHFRLLLFVLNVTYVVFLPYLGFLLGSTWAAFRHDSAGRTLGKPLLVQFARDLTTTAVFSKSGLVFLVVLPSLSLVFLYAQLLQGTPAIAAGLMAFGFLALIVASTLLAFYRYTFTLEEILADAVGEHPTADLESYRERNTRSHLTAGRYGVLALTLGVVLTVGASTVAGTPALWEDVNNVFDLLQTLEFWMRLVLFGALSLAATGVGVLFVFLSWQGGMQGMDGEYGTIVRRFGMRVSSVALLSVPLLILGSVVLMPAETLSGVLFLMLALGLAFLLLTAQFLYAFRRDGASRYTAYAFFALALALTVIFTKDQMAIGNATRVQAVRLALQNDKDFEDLKARLGIALVSMSGQEIYDAKCSACHLFDQKKVGPPYKSVLPKYADRKAALIAFVLNPAKVDPAYPNMPNQGLKPAEADSIATWLLSKFAPAKTAPAAAVPAAPGTKPQ